MAFKSYNDLNEKHKDVLQEIGNIGSGNAITSLSSMLSRPVDMNIPKVHILNYNDISELLGGPENTIVALIIDLVGDLNGTIMFLLNHDFSSQIIKSLIGNDVKDFNRLSEIECSVLMEISNIMAGSYVGALSQLTQLNISLSVPYICNDMVGAILDAPAVKYDQIGDRVIFIEDNFKSDNSSLKSNILMILDLESLNKLMDTLGIDI